MDRLIGQKMSKNKIAIIKRLMQLQADKEEIVRKQIAMRIETLASGRCLCSAQSKEEDSSLPIFYWKGRA